ncbi:alpha/beta hydrolase [Novosphingobium sp.]|uniref:alpha/beta hydrolase n=1 Tax=Novosphingobium sp. TaxID=1874826 RepID=UPI00260CA0B3|nr:alpha/beta hydrolase [Novosphingobium sp.]
MAAGGLTRRGAIGRSVAGSLAGALTLTAPALAGTPPGPRRLDLAAPDGRMIPVTEWRPAGRLRGTVLFFHGAGSSPQYYPDMVAAWVGAGHRVLAPLHVDSREHPRTRDFPGLASWQARIEDMRALVAHIGPEPYVAAGHSYGALAALGLGGAEPVLPAGMTGPVAPRLALAVIAFSPPAPIPVLITGAGYGALRVPALIQTGTLDILPGMGPTGPDAWRGHLAPFDAAAPGGHRYGLVLSGVNHYFGGAICDFRQPGPPQREALSTACAISRLFLTGFGEGQGAGPTRARRLLDRMIGDRPGLQLLRR